MNGSGPAFDFDLSYGEDGEHMARAVLGWTFTNDPCVEVKRKRYIDDFIYVELRQNAQGRGWRPSGLSITTADLWAYVIGDTGIVVYLPTDLLRRAVARDDGRPREETDGENPTQGRLLRISSLIQTSGIPHGS